MKNSILQKIAFVFSCAILTSCSGFLEEELVTGISSKSYYTTQDGIENGVKASYPYLRNVFGKETGTVMFDAGIDDFHAMGGDNTPYFGEYTPEINPQNGIFWNLWANFYKGINQCNAVLTNMPKVTNMPSAIKNKREGELRFLRALYYFYLTECFGDIHLTMEETNGIVLEANKTQQSDIYEKCIIPDLLFAFKNLEKTPSEMGRASKYAAGHLLSKAYLTRGYKTFAKSDDFSKAAAYADSVILMSGKSLLPDYKDIFKEGNEANNEIILSVQYSPVLLTTNGGGNQSHTYFLMNYESIPGMKRDIANGRSYSWLAPSSYLLSRFDRKKDSRYANSFVGAYICNNPSGAPKWTSADAPNPSLVGKYKFGQGDTACWLPGVNIGEEVPEKPGFILTLDFINKARYKVITPAQYDIKNFPSLKKHLDGRRQNEKDNNGVRDWFLMRLGETYLLAAEAHFKNNQKDLAAARINEIRKRAAYSSFKNSVSVNANEITLDFILDERSRELFGEGYRWLDLKRTGQLIERIQKKRLGGEKAAANIKDYHLLRPIPYNQIQRCTYLGVMGAYPQNPGYN